MKTDVSVPEDCNRLVAAALERFGTVNGLVNSAGATDRGTLLDTGPEHWGGLFNTNARGPQEPILSKVRGGIRNLKGKGQRSSPTLYYFIRKLLKKIRNKRATFVLFFSSQLFRKTP